MYTIEMTNKFDNIKDRILYIGEYKGIGRQNICKKIGMTYQNFTGEAKKRPINSTAIQNIIAMFPDISIEWLLTGEGEMLRNPIPSQVESQIDTNIPESSALIQIIKESNDRLLEMSQKLGALQEKIQAVEKENISLKGIIKRLKKDIANKRSTDLDANAYCLSPELYSEEFWLRQQEPSDIPPLTEDSPSESSQDSL